MITQEVNLALPLVSVGLPVYDRPGLLQKALESLTTQSYTNLEIIISDDCSPGEGTKNIIKKFMESDSRIRCYRQEKNLGHFVNHKFVFEKATGDYFFWANEDDEWHKNFVSIGIKILSENPVYDAWCCTMNNIDTFSRVIREYPSFSRFTSTSCKAIDIIRYLLEPEIMGKANIFHGIFRRDALSKTIREYFFNEGWGTDYCFNLAFLTRFNIIGTDRVLHYKRVIRPSDKEIRVDPIVIKDINDYTIPLPEIRNYIHQNNLAVRNTPYKNLVSVIILLRFTLLRIRLLEFYRIKITNLKNKIKKIPIIAIAEFLFHSLTWRRKFGYKRNPKIIDVRWRMANTCGVIQVPLSIVRACLVTPEGNSLFTIEETPHYQWLKTVIRGKEDRHARDNYREYIKTFYPKEDPDATISDAINLTISLQEQSSGDSLFSVVALPPKKNKQGNFYVVLYDGVHRSAIAKALGHEFIQCHVLSPLQAGE